MKTIKLFLPALLILLVSSCSDFLEPYPNGDISSDVLWEYQDRVQGLVNQAYENLPRNYNHNEGAYLDGATDNAVITSTTHSVRRWSVGTLTTGQDIFETYWNRNYQSIKLLNTFLQDRKGYNTRFLVDPRLNAIVRDRLQGEAYALRAWFYWDLLRKFGGKSSSGEMLGVPLVLEPLDPTAENQLARNTYDECVRQILNDLDSAYAYLPIAHRDFLVENPSDRIYAGGRYWGRMDGITTRALKSNVYLTWASPRFNPENDVSRWDSAAVNAKKVIDFKLTVDNVNKGFNASNAVNWFDPNSPEIVFSSRYNDKSDAMEKMFYPAGFQGNGSIGASQELVDAFPMANGYPIDHPQSGYDPTDPYQNRDPRFYSVIFHNDAKAIKAGSSTVMYTFENFRGGKDEANVHSGNSRTNYHIKKFVFMGLNWSDASVNKQPHTNFLIRWSHIVLNFAEAANHVVGANDAGKYGMSAKDAIQLLRSRKTYDNANGITNDPYLNIAAASTAQFDEFVKNERRIETCFEGMRFYDLRRWTTSLNELNKSVHGVEIVKEGATTSYSTVEVEPRSFQSAYMPIPYNEMLKNSSLVQNEGWEGWN